MGGIKNIIEGHWNELIGNNKSIANPRREICKKCPLYDTSLFGWKWCNPNIYLNVKTNDVSSKPKEGYIKGCACRIEAKITVPNEKCPAGKW